MLKERRKIRKTDLGSGGGEGGTISYPVRISHLARSSAIPARRASRLFNLVRFLNAHHILELGTSLGISAAYMAKADPNARIVTLEGCPELAGLARNNMEDLELKNVQVITGPFSEKLPEALNILQSLDLVFIDGDHREEPTLDYFHQCLPFTHSETIIIIDDIHYSKGMERAWESIASHPGVTVSIDLFYQGWILLKKELSHQRFVLRYP
jgi:predicted O-methyltransferase YrrM